MPDLRTWTLALALVLGAGLGHAAEPPLSRAQALKGLAAPDAAQRLAAVVRLGEVGRMADAARVLLRLADREPAVREQASAALWAIWSRSGDPAIDRLFAQGVLQMQASALDDALATFDEIIRRRPAFAEGWNKRATIYFLLGRHTESLKDVDETLRRNPVHFGALSGAGQIHLQLGHHAQALAFFRRALTVNPDLEALDQLIPALERQLQDKDRNST